MSRQMIELILSATGDTLYMVAVALLLGTLIGGPIGIFLATSARGELFAAPIWHRVCSGLVNATRSIPFIILAVAIVPLTRFVAGTSIGTTAALVPLTLSAIPFIARIVEGAIRQVEPGLIEAAQAMGARPFQIVRKVLVPEAMSAIINGLTLTAIALISYSAMVGAIGGGGLGDVGIRYGYQRFRPEVMLTVVVMLIALVQVVQWLGDRLARFFDHRHR